jgi:hypothetical protein
VTAGCPRRREAPPPSRPFWFNTKGESQPVVIGQLLPNPDPRQKNPDIRRRRLPAAGSRQPEIGIAWQEIVSQPAVHKLQNSDPRLQNLFNVVANLKKTWTEYQ